MSVEYTKARTELIVNAYNKALKEGANYDARSEIINQLASELTAEAEVEVSAESVRAKLVSEKIYQGKAKEAKTEGSMSKQAYLKALRSVTGLTLKSFDNATKVDIQAMFDWIVEASAVAEAEANS